MVTKIRLVSLPSQVPDSEISLPKVEPPEKQSMGSHTLTTTASVSEAQNFQP